MLVVARAVPYMVPAVHDFAKGAVVFFPTIDDDEEEDNIEREGDQKRRREIMKKNKGIFMSATTYAKLTLFIHHPSSSFFTLSAR